MKNIRFFLPENFHFLVVKFSMYLNRRVFVMQSKFSVREALEINYSYEPCHGKEAFRAYANSAV